MAVYKRSYRAYTGSYTPRWSRFLVIPRHAWRSVFQYRLMTMFYVTCFFFPAVCAIGIYLNNNLAFLAQYMQVPREGLLAIDGKFFLVFTNVQGVFAFLLTALVGPGLVSPDLVNGGLPLYFCRPFSRAEYVVGKMTALVALLSNITWIPGLLLWVLQASLADNWWRDNLWLAGAIFASAAAWIMMISLLALALSAWVRWRIVAGALMLVVLFLAAGIAQTINAVMRTDYGTVVDPAFNIEMLSMALFGLELPNDSVSVEQSLACLAAVSGLCLWLLTRKIRAYEVVR
jgi:ABC-2 type transport system permease protein